MSQTVGTRKAASDLLPRALFQHWRHSREEDSGDIEVYRSDSFDFPPAFGRDGFDIRPDGTFIQEDIGPADGIVEVPGRWTATGPRQLRVAFRQARPGFTFEIVSLDDEVLRIRRGDQAYGTADAMDEGQLGAYTGLPPASAFRRLDFENASVITLKILPPQFILRVSGTKPFLNMEVELVPVVHIRQPEYWEIEVVGSLRGIGLPVLAPYAVSLPVTGFVGTKGIEVVGATKRQRFDLVPQQTSQGECRDFSAFVDRQPPGPATLNVTGVCRFPTAGFSVELRRRVPQGFNPRDLLLDKIVTAPSAAAAEVITEVEVRYREETEDGFDSVTILPDIGSIPVEEVQ
jgi:hypothetical protein